ncbi:MAG: hypothetical protein NTX00_04385 [Candidatus Parcubacteria bacterium]|nr:hypothetical protein [Candidatus Parcubacteria bacterium]
MKNTTKTILFLLVICLILPIFPVQAAGNAIMKLTSAKTDYYVGDTIYVDIMVEPNGASLNTVRAIMNFTGGTVLSISDFSIGTAWPYQSPGRSLDNVNQQINVGGFILVDNVSQNSKFGTLIFKANQVGSSTITFATGSHLIDINQAEQINLSGCQGITINVLGAPPLPNQAPTFVPISDKSIDLGQLVNFHISATDPDNDNVTLTWDIPSDAVFSNVISGPTASGDLAWTPTAKGTYTLKFYATDDSPKGAKTSSLTVLVNVSVPPVPVNHAPIFQPVGNKQIDLGETVNFHVQATDPDNDKINLTWNIPSGAIFNNVINDAKTVSGDFSWTPSSQGVYTVIFTATDDSTLGPKSSNLTVSIGVSVPLPPPNHPPVFEPVAEKTINAGETLTFNVTATDPDKDNVALTLEPLENAILTPITTGITSTSRFSWTPQNFGVYYAVFIAQDDNKTNPLSSNLSVRITVFGGACPPCGGGACPICQCQEQVFPSPLPLGAPVISSPSHPIQDTWYANNQPQFVWQVSQEGIGYVFNLNQTPGSDPTLGYTFSQDKLFSFRGIADGLWFFHLKVKYDNGYGPTSHYQVKIDTTPPEFFKPSIETGILADGSKQYKLYFSALDKSSGMAYYEMKIDNGEWQKAQSPYVLNEVDKQGKILSLRAVDNAGNAIEAYVDLKNFVVIKKEPAIYNLIQPLKVIVTPPLIDHVIMPVQIGTILVKNVLMVTGRAEKNSTVTLHLSTVPETIVATKTSDQGLWLIYLNKVLEPGRYSLFATASLNGINSLPSEMVYFTLKEKFVPSQEIKIPWWLWLLIFIILLIIILILALKSHKLKKKLKKNKFLLKFKNKHERS